MITFTFDDFPRSALTTGGAVLESFGLAGTYYASFGLVGKDTPSGRIFVKDDLPRLLEHGHELGCHTFAHCHSWDTPTEVFEDSIIRNRKALNELCAGVEFRSFSYPISTPRPLTKAKTAAHFLSCRGGGQRANIGTTDLNQLSAFFLEQSRDQLQAVKDIIDLNRDRCGWLILVTHDIEENPTPYGCKPQFFEAVVRYAASSGSLILPVAKALEWLRSGDVDSPSTTTESFGEASRSSRS